jgi:DNA-binding protein HU-beta
MTIFLSDAPWQKKEYSFGKANRSTDNLIKEVKDLNKTELIAAVAAKAGFSKKVAGEAVDAVVSAVSDALKKGDKVTLIGFGTFEVRTRKARKGVNPATRTPIKIPAAKVPAFKAGKALKDAVAKK